MQKGFSTIFILSGVLLIIAIIGGAFYLHNLTFEVIIPIKLSDKITAPSFPTRKTLQASSSANLDQTADWKTYNNQNGKYSIKYPSDLSLHVNETHVFESESYQPAPNTIDIGPDVVLIEHKIIGNSSLNEFIKSTSQCEQITPETGEDVLLDQVKAKRYNDTPCAVADDTEVYATNNQLGYKIKFGNAEKSTIDSFLSTFKFTN